MEVLSYSGTAMHLKHQNAKRNLNHQPLTIIDIFIHKNNLENHKPLTIIHIFILKNKMDDTTIKTHLKTI